MKKLERPEKREKREGELMRSVVARGAGGVRDPPEIPDAGEQPTSTEEYRLAQEIQEQHKKDRREKRLIGKRISSFKGVVLLLALVVSVGSLCVGLGVSAWKAEPAEAVENGVNATQLGGQVQIRAGSRMQKITGNQNSEHVCTGSLIAPKWVLTAKHCVSKNPFSKDITTVNGRVLVGSLIAGQGDSYKVKNIEKNKSTDTALLELDREAPQREVIGYGVGTPTPNSASTMDASELARGASTRQGDHIQLRGWGLTIPRNFASFPNTLQEATLEVQRTNKPDHPKLRGFGARLGLFEINQGQGLGGDSGAGIYMNGTIYGVYSIGALETGQISSQAAVPTEDIAPWIEKVTGVGPSEDLNADQCETSEQPEQQESAPTLDPAPAPGTPATAAAPDKKCQEQKRKTNKANKAKEEQERKVKEEQERKAKEEQAKGAKSSRTGAAGKVGAGAGAGIAVDAIDDFLDGVDEGENTGEVAKGTVEVLKKQYPEHNVMLIQQETYDRDRAEETLEGVVFGPEDKSIQIGENAWDVWVFGSGTFNNKGDLGYENWAFDGTYERTDEDGNPDDSGDTVTFESALTEEEREKTEAELAEQYLANQEITNGYANEDNVKEVLKDLRTRFPSYNAMLINQDTYDKSEDTKDLQGVVPTDETITFSDDRWDVWLLDSGTITNPGDGGYENWAFDGNYERTDEDGNPDNSGNTVTFKPIEPTESEGSEEEQPEEEQPEEEQSGTEEGGRGVTPSPEVIDALGADNYADAVDNNDTREVPADEDERNSGN